MTTARPPLDPSRLKIHPLTDLAPLEGFDCGEREINRAIPKCVDLQSNHLARTYWLSIDDSQIAAGFYTLSISPANSEHLHPDITFGRNGYVSFVYLNYLGVDQHEQRQGLSYILLGHALRRCALVAGAVGSYGVALHALTQLAADIYYEYGFRAVDGAGDPPFMVLPNRSLFKLMREEDGGGPTTEASAAS